MDFEVSYDFENEQQLWDGRFRSKPSTLPNAYLQTNGAFFLELEEIVSRNCTTNDLIDDALRSYLNIATSSWGTGVMHLLSNHDSRNLTHFEGKYISSEYDIARCSYILLSSSLFERHEDYVRRQILHSLLQVR
jgi:hypothetical protein